MVRHRREHGFALHVWPFVRLVAVVDPNEARQSVRYIQDRKSTRLYDIIYIRMYM